MRLPCKWPFFHPPAPPAALPQGPQPARRRGPQPLTSSEGCSAVAHRLTASTRHTPHPVLAPAASGTDFWSKVNGAQPTKLINAMSPLAFPPPWTPLQAGRSQQSWNGRLVKFHQVSIRKPRAGGHCWAGWGAPRDGPELCLHLQARLSQGYSSRLLLEEIIATQNLGGLWP